MSQYNYIDTSSIAELYKNEWITPDWVFDPLNSIFQFTLDAAADEYNTKVKGNYFTALDDGLDCSWENETVFNNPPFTKGQYGKWVDKACLEFLNDSVETVQVLPFNPETKAFSGVWETAHYLLLPRKRIAFELPVKLIEMYPEYEYKVSPKFYSVVALYTHRKLSMSEVHSLLPIGRVLNLWLGLHS